MAELRPEASAPREVTMALIVVSGAPGTGKSTVAGAVARSFGLPLLSLDEIKEALADVLGTGGEDWSNQVGDAAAEVFCHCDPDLATARMRARLGTGRHPIHRDMINPAMIGRSAAGLPAVQPLALGGVLVTVDTSHPGAPDQAVTDLARALGR
ncbi:MAG TPA: AAA family ATPase [Streptosporangiaceae bacterium]|nr:AAA family ATPase [Streptosporangiaceae bacterium]